MILWEPAGIWKQQSQAPPAGNAAADRVSVRGPRLGNYSPRVGSGLGVLRRGALSFPSRA